MSQSSLKFKQHTYVFRSEWLHLKEFHGWLAPVYGDETKAWCNACERTFHADLKALQGHGISKLHTSQMDTYGCIPYEDYAQALENKKINRSISESAMSLIETNPTKDNSTSKRGTQSHYSKHFGVLPTENYDENNGPHTSSSNTEHIQKEVHVIDKTGNLVSVFTEHNVQKNKDNVIDLEAVLQSPEYHSSFNNEKMDQNHEDVQGKALVSKPAPFWKATAVVNGQVKELDLHAYKGRYLVLFFYPQDFSALCPTEILALSDRVSEFTALNTEVVACSVDSYLSHQSWYQMFISARETSIPKIALISDPTHTISKSYGCYLPDLGHSLRAHYIIDKRGILRHVTINDLSVGRDISEILRLLEAFQYTDGTKRVCLADWKPDKPSSS